MNRGAHLWKTRLSALGWGDNSSHGCSKPDGIADLGFRRLAGDPPPAVEPLPGRRPFAFQGKCGQDRCSIRARNLRFAWIATPRADVEAFAGRLG